jgi:hypothetical protein
MYNARHKPPDHILDLQTIKGKINRELRQENQQIRCSKQRASANVLGVPSRVGEPA